MANILEHHDEGPDPPASQREPARVAERGVEVAQQRRHQQAVEELGVLVQVSVRSNSESRVPEALMASADDLRHRGGHPTEPLASLHDAAEDRPWPGDDDGLDHPGPALPASRDIGRGAGKVAEPVDDLVAETKAVVELLAQLLPTFFDRLLAQLGSDDLLHRPVARQPEASRALRHGLDQPVGDLVEEPPVAVDVVRGAAADHESERHDRTAHRVDQAVTQPPQLLVRPVTHEHECRQLGNTLASAADQSVPCLDENRQLVRGDIGTTTRGISARICRTRCRFHPHRSARS